MLDLLGKSWEHPGRRIRGPHSLYKFRHVRLSSFQVIRIWIFWRWGLKVLFTPQNFSFFRILAAKFSGTSFIPPKGTSLRDLMSFELPRVKIYPRVWPICEPEKKSYRPKYFFVVFFTHLPRSPQWVDLYHIWYRGSSLGRNQLCRLFGWSVESYQFCGRIEICLFP